MDEYYQNDVKLIQALQSIYIDARKQGISKDILRIAIQGAEIALESFEEIDEKRLKMGSSG